MQKVVALGSAAKGVPAHALTSLFRSPLFPVFFQLAGLFIYMGLIWFSLGVDVPPGVKPKPAAQNTISSLLVWGIWLPLLIIVTVFLGRIWCAVCPLELVQQAGDFTGRKLFGKKLRLPGFLCSSMNGVFIYSFLLFMLIATRFPQVPGNTATLLTILAVSSLVAGLLFGNRIFCKYFCPADMLLRGLGRRGMVRIRHELPDENKRGTPVSKDSCPSHLHPKKLNDASPCILCGQCVKSNTALSPGFRPMPSAPDDKWKDYGWGITILAFFLSGFVIEHLFFGWQTGYPYYAFFPDMAKKAIGAKALAGWIEAIWTMIVVPGALWISMGLIGKVFGLSVSVLDIWKKITLPVITALTGAHLVLSVKKFSHWVTHARIAFSNMMEKVTTSLIPDSVFILRFPRRGHGHGHGPGPEEHLFSEPALLGFSVIIFVMFSIFLYKEVWKSEKSLS